MRDRRQATRVSDWITPRTSRIRDKVESSKGHQLQVVRPSPHELHANTPFPFHKGVNNDRFALLPATWAIPSRLSGPLSELLPRRVRQGGQRGGEAGSSG